jgi:hypothetical protein
MYSSKVAIVSAALSLWTLSAGAVTVTPADVMRQVGHTVRVCGLVSSATYEPDTRAHPTFLSLVSPDEPSAGWALTAVIFGDDRAKFGTLEMAMQGQRVCVTGFVSFFRHRPEMILTHPSQVSFATPPTVADFDKFGVSEHSARSASGLHLP